MSSPIPIANLYYMLAYSWNKLPESGVRDVGKLAGSDFVNLLAKVLVLELWKLIRRGLARNYVEREDEVSGIRGKLNMVRSIANLSFPRGRAVCAFDEFSPDILKNRIIKSALEILLRAQRLDAGLRQNVAQLTRGLSSINLSKAHFRRVQTDRSSRHYRFALNVCELIHSHALPDERGADYRFASFLAEKRMPDLFESFVRNFLRIERPDLDVKREYISWDASSMGVSDLHMLPKMETDISVRNRPHTRTLIIDTKFYEKTLQVRHKKASVHSGNLYQITSYLGNLKKRSSPDGEAAGMLLYPAVQQRLNLRYKLMGHEVMIRTVDLAAEWEDIHAEMLAIADAYFPSS